MPNYSDKSFASRFVDNSFASRTVLEKRVKQLEADTANSDASYRSDVGLGFVLEHSHPFMPWIDANGKWNLMGGRVTSRMDHFTIGYPTPLTAIGTGEYLKLSFYLDSDTGLFKTGANAPSVTANEQEGPILMDTHAEIALAKYDSTQKAVIPYYCYQNFIVPLQKYRVADVGTISGTEVLVPSTTPGEGTGDLGHRDRYRFAWLVNAWKLSA